MIPPKRAGKPVRLGGSADAATSQRALHGGPDAVLDEACDVALASKSTPPSAGAPPQSIPVSGTLPRTRFAVRSLVQRARASSMWTPAMLSAGFTGAGRRRLFRPGSPCGCARGSGFALVFESEALAVGAARRSNTAFRTREAIRKIEGLVGG